MELERTWDDRNRLPVRLLAVLEKYRIPLAGSFVSSLPHPLWLQYQWDRHVAHVYFNILDIFTNRFGFLSWTILKLEKLQCRPQWRGHGWVWVGSNPPTSKKAPWYFCKSEDFFGGGVGVGGRVEREKHKLCQIVLNKQQHHHIYIVFILYCILFNFFKICQAPLPKPLPLSGWGKPTSWTHPLLLGWLRHWSSMTQAGRHWKCYAIYNILAIRTISTSEKRRHGTRVHNI